MDYMDRELHEECGVFGIIGHQDASQICYYGLHSLQHRGQEAAGICCENNGKMIFHKGEGLVTEVFNQDKLKELQGNSAIGHVRYSTAGGGGIANVQPFVFRTMQGSMSICHNGNLVNANILKQELEEQGSIFSSTSDTEVLGHLIKRQSGHMIDRICTSLDKLDGAFAFLIMVDNRIYAARDKYGLRPLSIGILPNGAYVFASETCALDVVGAKFVRDVYYCREWQGKYYDIFYVLELTVWLTTLFFGMVGAFFEKRNRDLIVVAMLAIIGLTIFEQIFEARSRYLYIYVPIYILLAINGMSVLKVEICKRQIKIRQ